MKEHFDFVAAHLETVAAAIRRLGESAPLFSGNAVQGHITPPTYLHKTARFCTPSARSKPPPRPP
jgi:hypothetical protein